MSLNNNQKYISVKNTTGKVNIFSIENLLRVSFSKYNGGYTTTYVKINIDYSIRSGSYTKSFEIIVTKDNYYIFKKQLETLLNIETEDILNN